MTFREALTDLINSHSIETGSNTPDFILAEYLQDCLNAFDNATKARNKWYSRPELEPSPEFQPLPEIEDEL